MVKYKLIKEYPGSPELGEIIENKEGTNMYFFKGLQIMYPNKYPEFWQEVVKKDYEILSFICNKNFGIFEKGLIAKSTNKFHDMFRGITKYYNVSGHIEEFLSVNHWSIHSVKRLSDNEIFTIGDRVSLLKSTDIDIIKKFNIIDDKNTIGINGYLNRINCYKKVIKKLLFTTEDGVDIYEGDKYYSLYLSNNFTINEYIATNNDISSKYCLTIKDFSTKEKAQEYIKYNKPYFSLNDIISILTESDIDIRDEKNIVLKLEKLINLKK